MKRTGHLFEQIVQWHNLRSATAKALRGKRYRCETREFVEELDANLRLMQGQLLTGTVRLGTYRQFVIHDPKRRIITAPCFRERVLHHAIMNVCEPVFDRWLIDDTYACRRGRGRIVALERALQFARRYAYFAKFDIRRYFDSVPHASLITRLERLFKDRLLLDLLVRIISSYRGGQGIGLPIGSLTSQHFANFYLGWFDRAVKERWRTRGYLRYMDDMIIWSTSRTDIRRAVDRAVAFLDQELALSVKGEPYINHASHGVDFLGCRVHPSGLSLNRRSRVRFRRELNRLERKLAAGELTENEVQQRATSLVAFTRTAGVSSGMFRRRVLKQLPVGGQEARTG